MSECFSPSKHHADITDARGLLKGLRSISLRNLTISGGRLNSTERDSASVTSGSLPSLRAQIIRNDSAVPRDPDPSNGAGPLASSGKVAGTGGVLLTTGVAKGTLNPTWAVSETSWLHADGTVDELEHTRSILLRVYSVAASTDTEDLLKTSTRKRTSATLGQGHSMTTPSESDVTKAVWDCVIDVRGLTALPPRTRLPQLWSLPADCLFVEMSNGGLYSQGWVVEALESNSALPQLSRVSSGIGVSDAWRDGSDNDDDEDQEPIDEVLRKVLKIEKEAEKGRAELSAFLESSAADQSRAFEDAKQHSMIARLRLELSAQESLLSAEEACLEREKRQLQNDAAAVEELLTDLSGAEAAAAADARELNGEEREALKSHVLLEARRARLTAELQAIYPIKYQEKSREYSIRGLELPMDLYSIDDERVSSALGYTAHLVCMLAKYLQVPLRYQLIYNASRSAVRDNITGAGVAYPLFRRGVEKERFDRGVVLLGRDVEQMLTARGVPVKRGGGQLLRNLERLMAVESA